MFEDLVWDILLARGFSDGGLQLSCRPLDTQLPIEMLTQRLNEYFVSTLDYPNSDEKWAALLEELQMFQERCSQLNVTLLYRCPKGCKGVDFFVFFADGTNIAVQTSISTLLGHSTSNTIVDIPRLFRGVDRGISIARYVFITVKPEPGSTRTEAILSKLPHVRIVDANDWLGF
jgi:hypothetical protein